MPAGETEMLRRRFQVLLLGLIALLIVYPLLQGTPAERLVYDALVATVFLGAMLAVFTERRMRIPALVLGIPTIAGVCAAYVVPGLPRQPVATAFHVAAALFFAFAVAAILRAIHREETVSADAIYGAFCAYLLVAMGFGHLYCLLELLKPGSFQGGAEVAAHLRSEARGHFLLTYYSLMTLTTVGYGDVAPATASARGLAAVEAVVGQFFIAVLVAELIGKRVSQALEKPR